MQAHVGYQHHDKWRSMLSAQQGSTLYVLMAL